MPRKHCLARVLPSCLVLAYRSQKQLFIISVYAIFSSCQPYISINKSTYIRYYLNYIKYTYNYHAYFSKSPLYRNFATLCQHGS